MNCYSVIPDKCAMVNSGHVQFKYLCQLLWHYPLQNGIAGNGLCPRCHGDCECITMFQCSCQWCIVGQGCHFASQWTRFVAHGNDHNDDQHYTSIFAIIHSTFAQVQQGINDFIQTICNTLQGEALKLTILHSNEMTLVEVLVQPKVTTPGGPQSIGVLLTPNFVKTKLLQSDSVLEVASMAAQYTMHSSTNGCWLSEYCTSSRICFGLMGFQQIVVLVVGSSITGLIGLIKVALEIF